MLLALDTSVGVVDPEVVIAARLGVSRETLRLVAKRFADTGGARWRRSLASSGPVRALPGHR